jgi:predicted RNA-binding Zn-ribbon protein involved in translation (DUF1610 family)
MDWSDEQVQRAMNAEAVTRVAVNDAIALEPTPAPGRKARDMTDQHTISAACANCGAESMPESVDKRYRHYTCPDCGMHYARTVPAPLSTPCAEAVDDPTACPTCPLDCDHGRAVDPLPSPVAPIDREYAAMALLVAARDVLYDLALDSDNPRVSEPAEAADEEIRDLIGKIAETLGLEDPYVALRADRPAATSVAHAALTEAIEITFPSSD